VRTSFDNVEFGRHPCTPKGSVHAHRIGQKQVACSRRQKRLWPAEVEVPEQGRYMGVFDILGTGVAANVVHASVEVHVEEAVRLVAVAREREIKRGGEQEKARGKRQALVAGAQHQGRGEISTS